MKPGLIAASSCLCILLTISGCEEDVFPNLGIDRPYTMWGLLNPDDSLQAVRVFEIQPTIKLVSPDPIDVTVISTHLESGEQRTWQDSVVQLPDGDYRHVFWSGFRPIADHTYRVESIRSDGATSSAEVRVPPPITLEVVEPDTGQFSNITVPIRINGVVPTFPRIELRYLVAGITEFEEFFETIYVAYEKEVEQTPGGSVLNIDLSGDFITVRTRFGLLGLPIDRYELREMELIVHVGNEGWEAPGGVFDPNVLVEPGLLSNVNNGFGYIASGYMRSITWRPPGNLLRRVGYESS